MVFTLGSEISISCDGKLEFSMNSGPLGLLVLELNDSSSLLLLPMMTRLRRRTRNAGSVANLLALLRSVKLCDNDF